ncbi:MAG: hypothetical protein R6U65_00845 [Perlabentimonas sp.]
MKNLFLLGGPVTMSILTILLVIMIAWMSYHLIIYLNSKKINQDRTLRMLKYGKSIGLLTMIVGITAQLLGFYMAFSVIELGGDISPAMVFGGLKVSMISTLYGLLTYLLSIMIWFVASQIVESSKHQKS